MAIMISVEEKVEFLEQQELPLVRVWEQKQMPLSMQFYPKLQRV